MAPAISKPLLSDLVAQIGKVPSSHIRPVGDRPDLANVDNESGAGIPLIDLKKLNGPERRKVVAAIGRACESDSFFMVTNHGGVPAPAGVVEGMLRVDGELFHFHLPESSERLKCYSDDPIKAAEARALLESLGLELERSHMVAVMGRDGAVVDQWPSNPPSSFRQVVGTYATEARALPLRLLEAISECVGYSSSNLPYSSSRTVWGENMHRAIQGCMHKLGRSSPSSCLPIIVNDPSPHGSETESPFSPLFILERNNVKVEVITNEATADEDVSKFDLATIAGTLSLVVPVAINIDELTKTWGPLWKVLCGIFMIMSLMLAFIGLFTASFSSGSRARNLSSHCARMSLVVTSTIMFMLLISSKLGCFGCAAGVVLVLVMLVLTVLWIRSEHEI